MKLERCANGHFFDAERYPACPHCPQTDATTIQQPQPPAMQQAPAQPSFTPAPVSEPEDRLAAAVNQAKGDEDAQKTIGYFGEISSEPVVGWLVCIEGTHFGEDFKLKTGRNFIGRSTNMDVCLRGDSSVSREKHAILLYEPKSNIFLVQPGDSKELFYLNNEVVLTAEKIKQNDVLSIGDSKLMFIPCCNEKFNWDMVKKTDK